MAQRIVIQFIHQLQQLAHFICRKTFTRKPAQIVSGQVGEQAAFVFAIRHFAGDQL